MATPSANFAESILDFAASMLAEKNLVPRARIVVQSLAAFLPASAVIAYIFDDGIWKSKAVAGEIKLEGSEFPSAGTLLAVEEKREALVFAAADISREDYAHLNIPRTFASLTYLPLISGDKLLGTLEIVSYAAPFSESDMEAIAEGWELTALAFASAIATEKDNSRNLESIARLTELYDLELVFSSTLEMDELTSTVTSKIQHLTNTQAVNLWMVEDADNLVLIHSSGFDPTSETGRQLKVGEGIASGVVESGESVIIESSDDERLAARNAGVEDGAIFSLIATPLVHDDKAVGVLETINRMDGNPFDEDDLFLLTTVASAAAIALHNASLMHAARKLEIMETLVTVSHEITSTLNLERMLQTIVNAPQAVIPYERAAIALEQRGIFKLSAVTGMIQVNADAPDLRSLNEVLQWAALSGEIIDIRQHDGEIDEVREETKAKFQRYFDETGVRGFYARPLIDDTGRVGILCMESSDPDFLSPAHLEIVQVLANQATVALRNAQMYKEVPFISVLEPVLERKRKFMALEKQRRKAIYIGAIVAAVALVALPLPMRVDGNAVVAPAYRAQVQPHIEGVVTRVLVREGDRIRKGQVLAEIGDTEFRSAVAAAKAKYDTALLAMNRALSSSDGTEAGMQKVQADYWAAEVARTKQQLEDTKLRSPIDGVVATPQVENLVGRRLEFGDTFAEVVDTSTAVVDVAIDNEDVGFLRKGAPAAVNLNFYPTKVFRGEVVIVSPKGEMQGDSRVFFARVNLPNSDGVIRSGMEGRGKVRVGWRPAGYVMFRGLVLWAYTKVWNWFGW
jgi:RND family efflux transporter MFP subunit